ncbi:hypothetical protein V6N12_066349 [Hibiscus sabdariffa]|uniref:Uncharacterized protein n=1 Tax=Hibiscus sabdariffa TaxID=183260 RepID=A0ABR2CQC3_9ROSI
MVRMNGFCTFIYGPPYAEEKQQFWEGLSILGRRSSDKWCIIGDTNIVTRSEDKLGGAPFGSSQAKYFLDFVDKEGLLELSIKGGTFTWSNQRCEADSILEKLDRIIISPEWSSAFPKAIGIIEAAMASNPSPLILLIQGLNKKGKKNFKFESKWLLDEECFHNVREEWELLDSCGNFKAFGKKLNKTRSRLIKWNKVKNGSSKKSVEILLKEIKQMQDSVLPSEEAAKLKEIKAEVENDMWLDDDAAIAAHFQEFFRKVYTKDEMINPEENGIQ